MLYIAIHNLWSEELEKTLLACQTEREVLPGLNVKTFLDSFTALLYHARMVGHSLERLYGSAYFMLRGIMTSDGMERLEQIRSDLVKTVRHTFNRY